jgi:hypothetical protein
MVGESLYAVVMQRKLPNIKDPFGSLKVLETFKTKEEAENFKDGVFGFEIIPVPVPKDGD